MRNICAAAIIGILVSASPTGALAEEGSAAPAQARTEAAAKSDYQNRLICTKKTATGSLISKKTCKTRAQIDAERKDAQRMLHNQKRTGAGSNGTAVISDF